MRTATIQETCNGSYLFCLSYMKRMYHLLSTVLSLVVLASVLIASNRNSPDINPFNYKFKCGALNPDVVFMDMHDGDCKSVTRDGDSMTIKPHDNNETWVVHALIDSTHCNATVDFNVPGKPNPPPVNLTATFWRMVHPSTSEYKSALEFTDPSGTLAPPTMPLNVWIMVV